MRSIILFLFLLSCTCSWSQKKSLEVDSIRFRGSVSIGAVSSNTALGVSDRAVPTQKAVKTYVDNSFDNNTLRNSKSSGDTLLTKVGTDGVVKRVAVTGQSVTKTVTDSSISYVINTPIGTRFVAPTNISPYGETGPATTVLPAANTVIVTKFYLPYSIVLNNLGAYITTSASSSVYLGLYDNSGNKIIGTTVSGSSNGIQTAITGGITLLPGFYWSAWSSGSTSVRLSGWLNNGLVGLDMDNTVYGIAANSMSGGVFPATLGAISSWAGNGPFIILSN